MADSYNIYPNLGGVPKYASFSSLPASPADGDTGITIDTDTLYVYNGTAWVILAVGASTLVAVTDTSTIDLTNSSGTLSADIVAGSITDTQVSATAGIAGTKIQAADVSNPGVVTTTSQSFAGLKTFTEGLQPGNETLVSNAAPNEVKVVSTASGTGIGWKYYDPIALEAKTAKIFSNTPGSEVNVTLPAVSGTLVGSGDTGSVTSTMIANETIVNADVSPTAAIAGSKIDPTFATSVTVPTNEGLQNSGTGSTLNIGTLPATSTLNLGLNANQIFLGGNTTTLAISGTLAYVNSIDLDVADKLITINKNGLAGSGFDAGIQVEEASTISAYVRTSTDRDSWVVKAPNTTGTVKFSPGSSDIVISPILDGGTF